jgi:hypothetical protein
MGARESFSLRQQGAMPVPATVPVAEMPVVVNRVEPRREPVVSVPQAATASVAEREPEPIVSAPSVETTIGGPVIPTAPVQTPPVPTGGKPITIYVNLVGEGMNMMRQVQAEHLGRDFYIIVDPMPVDETWEFGTGQVVKCRKKSLSNGKGLVAYEEAPRAQLK